MMYHNTELPSGGIRRHHALRLLAVATTYDDRRLLMWLKRRGLSRRAIREAFVAIKMVVNQREVTAKELGYRPR